MPDKPKRGGERARRYYGVEEELLEVAVTAHPEGRYAYTMDM